MVRLWLAMIAGAGFLVISGVIASMARAQPTGDPTAVITAYEMARNRHDLDAALTYFADNAVITQRNTTFSGKDEIRKYLDTASTRSRYVVISDRNASGNIVTWTERTTLQGNDPSGRIPQGTAVQNAAPGNGFSGRVGVPGQGGNGAVTTQPGFAVSVEAVVMDGRIQSMAYIFGSQSTRPDPALDGRAQLPASIGLAAVALLMLGLLMVASMGFGRATPGASSLRGRLMHDLQGWAAARE
jgi:ketosteroid isomerase-like protein